MQPFIKEMVGWLLVFFGMHIVYRQMDIQLAKDAVEPGQNW